MEKVVYNKKGVPLLAMGKQVILSASGSDVSVSEKAEDEFSYKGEKYVSWGLNNSWPEEAAEIVGKVGVLSTGIDYRCRTCAGSGVIPARLTGIDGKCRETFEPFSDLNVIRFLNSYSFRRYHFEALRDLFKFGDAFPLLVFNVDSSKIVRIQTINARHCRLSVDKKRLLVYNDFRNGIPGDGQAKVYDMLDEADPFWDLDERRRKGKLKGGKAFAFPRLRNYFSSSDYYALPAWDAVRRAGWIDIYTEIPKFLASAYRNAMNLMWHINIPYSYLENMFPEADYSNNPEKDRQKDFTAFFDSIEKNLCSSENANKAVITPYNDDPALKDFSKWEITKLDNTNNAMEKLSTSVAANSEILFSLMINPAVFGAGMPGGAYAGNNGSGSDIREAFMVSLILNHCERQLVMDPPELMLHFNGYEDIDIKYRNLLLTTLDTGHSSEEKIS